MAVVVASQTLLDDARKSYHALMTGTSARVVVDMDGSRVEFTAANKTALYNYISELAAQINAATGVVTDMRKYHPATFVF